MKTAIATADYPYYCANCGAYVDWPKWYPFCSMGCIRGWKERTIREFLWQLLTRMINHECFERHDWVRFEDYSGIWNARCSICGEIKFPLDEMGG